MRINIKAAWRGELLDLPIGAERPEIGVCVINMSARHEGVAKAKNYRSKLRVLKEGLNECGNVPPRSDELAKTREKLRPAYADGALILGFKRLIQRFLKEGLNESLDVIFASSPAAALFAASRVIQ